MLDLTQRLWSNDWRERRSAEQRACAGQRLAAFARRVLDEKARRLHAHASAIASGDAAALHRLRIDAKKLRYGCQFFASLFINRKADAYIERLSDLQDILGKINDMASAMRLDQRLSAGARPSLQGALAYVDGFSAGSLQELAAQLAPVWKRLQRTDSFWKKQRRNGSHSVETC
jgi:CHAD domain-containing protein